MKTAELKRLVVKSALRVVDPAILQVDPSYQREVKSKHKRIVASFNEEAFGIPVVGEREDLTLWIVDGLQRITAIKKLGRTKVRVEVFRSSGMEHEAKVFKLINVNRQKLTVGEEFRALLTSGDEVAWAIKECVEKCGYNLRLSSGGNNAAHNNSKDVLCISTLQTAYKTAGSLSAIEFSLKAVKECWPDDRYGVNANMVGGLVGFHNRNNGVVDLERLYPRLRSVTPQKILYAAGQSNLGGAMQYVVADQIERVYNKRLGRQAK